MTERTGMRNARYGEIIVVTGGPLRFTGQVYNTIGLNNCPEKEWKALDPEQLKTQYKARAVLLNGPRYFLMDSNAIAHVGQTGTFGGLKARLLADVEVPLGNFLRGGTKPYKINTVARKTRYTFKAGKPIYTLLAPDGGLYVMQSYAQIVDPTLKESDLAGLGRRLKLPKGWAYEVHVPKEDFILSADGKAKVMQDELKNTYQHVGNTR